MKVLHVCVTGPYTEGWNYQENLITKYHSKQGYDVYIIASEWAWGSKGKIEHITDHHNYINGDGVNVYRLPIKKDKNIFYRFKRFQYFYETIDNIGPDIIFIHNIQFVDISQIVKYASKNNITIYVDNHADYSNSARTFLAKLFYQTVWRYYAQKIAPFTSKFYGVIPSRVDFLYDVYKLPRDKIELLVLGADDDLVDVATKPEVKQLMRKKHNIQDDDFLIVTGGKIDQFKTQTLLLMEAIKRTKIDKIKLLVFGSIDETMKTEADKLFDGEKIIYLGWIDSEESYKYFASSDLVVFPGRHSVYWEQAAGVGVPLICKYWSGTTHIDVGGNAHFLYEDSTSEIQEAIENLFSNKSLYSQMKKTAQSSAKEMFSYQQIALKSLMI